MLIPKQHGAWAMLFIPFALEMLAGGSTVWHIPLFAGWLLLYLATYPLTLLCKKQRKKKQLYQKWALIYSLLAIVCLLPILWVHFRMVYFGLVMAPMFLINLYYAKKNRDRAFLNDLAAIAAFCVGGLASYYLGAGKLTKEAWVLALHSFLFFLGTTFYVKTMIREKKNKMFKYYSWGYYILLPFIILAIGGGWKTIAYVPSMLRAWFLYGRTLPIMTIGIIEIAVAVLYFLGMVFLPY
ncbi:YwiC-like family protein [Bacillus sp. 1P06AnD]|uniref:YwiC-like family protein n=1 Tax=Bacillus sp. 1P06AnD TaxID=3132208 RepID=UPI0039A11B9F